VNVIPTPSIPVLARAKGDTAEEIADWFVEYFNRRAALFNYRRGTRIVRHAYRGLHTMHLLRAGCAEEKTVVGRASNSELVSLAAPYAFGREVRVFDLSPRRFAFGRDRHSGYRVPFLFVENRIIHAYFLQPTKSAGLTLNELGMVATIIKRFLLDDEFYGERTEIEAVDIGIPQGASCRIPRKYSLGDLPIWTDSSLQRRLTMISQALDIVSQDRRIAQRHHTKPRPEPEMPLFD